MRTSALAVSLSLAACIGTTSQPDDVSRFVASVPSDHVFASAVNSQRRVQAMYSSGTYLEPQDSGAALDRSTVDGARELTQLLATRDYALVDTNADSSSGQLRVKYSKNNRELVPHLTAQNEAELVHGVLAQLALDGYVGGRLVAPVAP